MFQTLRRGLLLSSLTGVTLLIGACQTPTSSSDTFAVDDFLETSVSPDPVLTGASSDGKTYRVVRGNNQPDDILAYDWKGRFTVNLRLNDKTDDNNKLTFPIDVTSATVKVQQASGGIVSPPTGGDTEHYEYVLSETSSSRFAGINTGNTMTFDVWYDLPSLRKEALVTVSLSFKDTNGVLFSKSIDVKVAP
jgi:hypothetical protein